MSAGRTKIRTSARAPTPSHWRRLCIRFNTSRSADGTSCLRGAAAQREDALRTLLNEENDEDQHRDLAEHRPRERLEQLVENAEAERRDDGAHDLSDSAEHHHHEGVDDVRLAELGADVAELRESDAAEPREP